eukprot:1145719-Pelagomonas_calceolata.AAC.3
MTPTAFASEENASLTLDDGSEHKIAKKEPGENKQLGRHGAYLSLFSNFYCTIVRLLFPVMLVAEQKCTACEKKERSTPLSVH